MTIPCFEVMFHVVFKKGTIPYICYWWNNVSFFVGSFTTGQTHLWEDTWCRSRIPESCRCVYVYMYNYDVITFAFGRFLFWGLIIWLVNLSPSLSRGWFTIGRSVRSFQVQHLQHPAEGRPAGDSSNRWEGKVHNSHVPFLPNMCVSPMCVGKTLRCSNGFQSSVVYFCEYTLSPP